MIKVEKCEDKVCNSCIDESKYKIVCKINEHNGCEFYLCEDCMRRLIEQVNDIKTQMSAEELMFELNGIL